MILIRTIIIIIVIVITMIIIIMIMMIVFHPSFSYSYTVQYSCTFYAITTSSFSPFRVHYFCVIHHGLQDHVLDS